MTNDTFSMYHPVINFVFYIGAFAFGMIFFHPLFWGGSLCAAMLYHLTIQGRSGIKLIFQLFPLYLGMTIINPVFNTQGERILFTYINGRPYTLEALLYGMALASVMVTVLLWFASYNIVMTSDKFLYLFGWMIPSLSLVFTMILRLLPDLTRKIKQIEGARKGIGLSVKDGNFHQKVKNGMVVLTTLTTWALEDGIVMADSMKSRGYGTGKRSSFSIYHFHKGDVCMLITLLVLAAIVIYCIGKKGTEAVYTPQLYIERNGYSFVGAASYFLFLFLPTSVNIAEDIKWYILRSKI